MQLTLGINNCFAVRRWPRVDEWSQVVSDELGLSTVQHSLDLFGLDPEPAARAAAVRQACEARGVAVHSVFTGLIAASCNLMLGPEPDERERGQRLWETGLEVAAAIGARSFGGVLGGLSRPDADDPRRRAQLWEELGRRIEHLRRAAHGHGLEALLIENMPCDRDPCRMAELEALAAPAEPGRAAVRLCLDVGHQCWAGAEGADADPCAWLARLGRVTGVVHLQQSDEGADRHWPFTADYNARGRIEASRLLEALAQSGTEQVTLILEVIPASEADDRRVLEELRESVDYWREALGERSPTGSA